MLIPLSSAEAPSGNPNKNNNNQKIENVGNDMSIEFQK